MIFKTLRIKRMTNKKVSVISSIYYPDQRCFRRFLDACVNQTLQDIEFIFIFDAPEDVEARNILKEYKNKFENLIVIENEKNLGVKESVKKGLSIASGKYIFNPDSDDFFDNDLMEEAYKYIEKINEECIRFDVITGYVNDAVFNEMYCDTQTLFYTKDFGNRNLDLIYITNYNQEDGANFKIFEKYKVLPFELGLFYYYVKNDNSTTFAIEEGFGDKINISNSEEFYGLMKRSFLYNYNDCDLNDKMTIQEMKKHLMNIGKGICNKDFSYEDLTRI